MAARTMTIIPERARTRLQTCDTQTPGGRTLVLPLCLSVWAKIPSPQTSQGGASLISEFSHLKERLTFIEYFENT